jgi:hypothetical protein
MQQHRDDPVQSHAPNQATETYGDSPFANQLYATGHAHPQVDPNALAQAMSFMATPVGMQTIAAFATHMSNAGNAAYVHPSPNVQTHQTPRHSPIQQAGQKRKWEERNNHAKQNFQQLKPPRAKAAVAPPVPSFGFSLPKAPSTVPPKNNAQRDSKKGKVRLGLTRQTLVEESSEEDEVEVDEEAVLGAKLKGGGYAFEHEGEFISLQTAADLVEWRKERKRHFPTQQKAIEKAETAVTRRRNELEFVRKLNGKPPRPVPVERKEVKPKVYKRNQEEEKKQEELAALRKKLHESMVKKRDAPTAVDLGLGYGSETESEKESSVLSESSVISSSVESSDDSDAVSEDSDTAPKPVSAKLVPPALHEPPPPVLTQKQSKSERDQVCNNWSRFGKCPFGHSCRFRHPHKEEKRTGLYEKLVEQELVKADQMALEAIKYLGQNGFLG